MARHFTPKLNMQKFDGKYMTNWPCQMDQFFDLHHVPYQQKVMMMSLYFELDQLIWFCRLFEEK